MSTSMGAGGEDIQMSPLARDKLGIQVECKNWQLKSLPVWDFMDQAKAHGPHEPVVFVKRNHKKPLVIIDADYYIELLKRKD